MAGLPGTGLGGLFYVLLVMWMAVRECLRLARGTSTVSRWAKIGFLGGLSAAIVAALWLEALALQALLGSMPRLDQLAAKTEAHAVAVDALTPALAAAPFLVLALLIAAIHLARLLLRPAGRTAAGASASSA